MTAPGPVPVTTDSVRRLHYAHEHTPNEPGARVRTLCGDAGFDQHRYDALREANPSWWKPIDITTLPACKTCYRAANHRGDPMPHDPFAVAEQLAPIPATREQATTQAWIRHYAALSLAAFAALHQEVANLPPNPQPGTRPDIGYLSMIGVTALAAAHAHTGSDARADLWDLIPEAGALNGEWEEWLAETLDRHGINPADIDPRYNSGDFNTPSRAAVTR